MSLYELTEVGSCRYSTEETKQSLEIFVIIEIPSPSASPLEAMKGHMRLHLDHPSPW
jgi:hypothetical protein